MQSAILFKTLCTFHMDSLYRPQTISIYLYWGSMQTVGLFYNRPILNTGSYWVRTSHTIPTTHHSDTTVSPAHHTSLLQMYLLHITWLCYNCISCISHDSYTTVSPAYHTSLLQLYLLHITPLWYNCISCISHNPTTTVSLAYHMTVL